MGQNFYDWNARTRVLFGPGRLNELGDQPMPGRRAMIVISSGKSTRANGYLDRTEAELHRAGVETCVYDGIGPNPLKAAVEEGARQIVANGCDFVVALGGGSVLDAGKVMAMFAAQPNEDLWDFAGGLTGKGMTPSKPSLPWIAITTTAGTGSEVTVAAVITDTKRNYKLSVLGPQISPDYAVLDPELIMTAPASVAAACGVDALIHAMESYINTDANPFSKAMAEAAMSLIGGNIRAFVGNRGNADAACAMMLGSCLAGIAFANNRLGDIHAMSHPVSAFFNVPHGVANAVLMPKIFEFNAICADERYAKIYEYVTGKKAGEDFVPQMTCDALAQLNADLGIPAHFADVAQVKANGGAARFEELIPQMAIDAMKSGNVTVNPRATTVKDVEALYALVK